MILLDTDVLVDVALDRAPHAGPASDLLTRIERGYERASIAWHSVSNLFYIVSPAHGRVRTRDFIAELINFVDIAVTDTEALRYATRLPVTDFEDAMQITAARACGARCIVTRNLRDYVQSPIPAVSPQDVLDDSSL